MSQARRADVAGPLDVPGRAARLWIGSARAPVPPGVHTVVTVAPEVSPLDATDVVEHRHPFADTRWRPAPRDILDAAVSVTCRALGDGEVLVRCRMGANRSPLVAALVLRQAGRSPGQAIDDVRRARGPLALSNPYFRDLVHCWPDDPMARPT